jgi:phage gp36-like protein
MARFIQDEDYDITAREEIVDLLDGSEDSSKLKRAERTAISQIKKWLSKRYDMNVMFAPAPDGSTVDTDPRDYFIVMTVIDIALYHLWTGVAAGRMPEERKARYNDALVWLHAEGKGESGAGDMPEKTEDDYPEDYRIVSRPPTNHKF